MTSRWFRRLKIFAMLVNTSFLLLFPVVAPAAPVKIALWHFFGPNAEGPVIDQMVAQFNKEHEGEIEVEAMFFPWGDPYYNKLDVALAGGAGPDLALSHTRYLGKYSANQGLYDINEVQRLTGFTILKKDYVPPAWEAANVDRQQLGVPLDIIVSVLLYYNADLFRKAGLDDGRPPQDRPSYIETAKKINGLGDDVWGSCVMVDFSLYRYFFTALYQAGGVLLDDSGPKFASPQGIQAIEFFADLVRNGLAPWPGCAWGANFPNGKIGCGLDGAWSVSTFSRVEGFDYRVASVPRFFNDRSFYANSHNFVLPKQPQPDPAKLRAALQFADWWGRHSITWAEAGQVPARLSVARSNEFGRLPHRAPMMAQIEFARYSPAVPQIENIENILTTALMSVMNGSVAAPAALEDASRRVAELLK